MIYILLVSTSFIISIHAYGNYHTPPSYQYSGYGNNAYYSHGYYSNPYYNYRKPYQQIYQQYPQYQQSYYQNYQNSYQYSQNYAPAPQFTSPYAVLDRILGIPPPQRRLRPYYGKDRYIGNGIHVDSHGNGYMGDKDTGLYIFCSSRGCVGRG
ncbi:hypothetical protein L5515_013169 [Caenorhabditis briggsae]|uniref:Uncharacterized protein n=1 Tax=Caenorhabditis briggsae TaxID=6238 RepID=A0AAE9EAK2_CAEBR|nr:hypothetical protein L5515_013169 [Caenorhabditis briggsae]